MILEGRDFFLLFAARSMMLIALHTGIYSWLFLTHALAQFITCFYLNWSPIPCYIQIYYIWCPLHVMEISSLFSLLSLKRILLSSQGCISLMISNWPPVIWLHSSCFWYYHIFTLSRPLLALLACTPLCHFLIPGSSSVHFILSNYRFSPSITFRNAPKILWQ